MPDPCQKALLSVILHRFLLFVILHERAKLQYSDAFVGDLAIGNAFDSLVSAPAHSANWQPMCAITCAFVEVQTMSGYRFRVVLCAYERYIIPLYMYYRVVVGKTLKFFLICKGREILF